MGDLLGKLVKSLAYSMGKELVKEGVSRIRDFEENDEDIKKHPSNCLKNWLKAFKAAPAGVIIVAGKQGGGKSALCYALAQYTGRRPIYVITVASVLLLGTKPVPCIADVPHGAVCVIDDASYFYASMKKEGGANSHQVVQDLIIFARKMDICFIFNTQNLGLLDLDVIRQCRALIFKEPGLMQAETERRGVKKYIEKAVAIFQKIPVLKRKQVYYLVSDDCEAIGKNGLPVGWNQKISTSIGNVTDAEYKIVDENKSTGQKENPKENIIDELKNKEKAEKAILKEKALLIKNEYCPECRKPNLRIYETYWQCEACGQQGAME